MLPDPVPPLAVPLESQALNFYIRNYTNFDQSTPEIIQDHSRSLHSLLSQVGPESPLHLIVSALSHTIFGHARNVPDALATGNKFYSMALAQCEYTLGHYSQHKSADLALTATLMATYEVIHFPPIEVRVENGRISRIARNSWMMV